MQKKRRKRERKHISLKYNKTQRRERNTNCAWNFNEGRPGLPKRIGAKRKEATSLSAEANISSTYLRYLVTHLLVSSSRNILFPFYFLIWIIVSKKYVFFWRNCIRYFQNKCNQRQGQIWSTIQKIATTDMKYNSKHINNIHGTQFKT